MAAVLEGTPDPDDYIADNLGIIELELYANSADSSRGSAELALGTPPVFGEQAIGGMALRAFPED